MNSGPIPRSMRDCEVVRDLIAAEAEGCLDSAERELLDRHLPQCAKCRDEFARLRVLYEQMQTLGSQPAPLTRAEEQERWDRMRAWLGDDAAVEVTAATILAPRAEGGGIAAVPRQPSVAPAACAVAPIVLCPPCAPMSPRRLPPYAAMSSIALAVAGLLMLGVGLHTMFAPGRQGGMGIPSHRHSAPPAVDEGSSVPTAPVEAHNYGPPPPLQSSSGDVRKAYFAWLKAWESRDIDAYMACYAPDCTIARSGKSSYGWSLLRTQMASRFAENSFISIRSDEPAIEIRDDTATVTVRQEYNSSTWHDTGTKRLVFVLRSGRWLILRESFSMSSGSRVRRWPTSAVGTCRISGCCRVFGA